ALDGQQRGQLSPREPEVARDRDAAETVSLALVDRDEDGYRATRPRNFRLRDLNIEIPVVVVEGADVIDVFLQLLLFQRTGAGKPAQEVVLAGFHDPAQSRIRKCAVAGEFDLGDLDLLSFVDIKYRDDRVVRLQDRAEGNLGVQVTLVFVHGGNAV